MAAQFEIRQHRLDAARQILGMAIGSCPKDKLFKAYIDIEYSLGNMDRCPRSPVSDCLRDVPERATELRHS